MCIRRCNLLAGVGVHHLRRLLLQLPVYFPYNYYYYNDYYYEKYYYYFENYYKNLTSEPCILLMPMFSGLPIIRRRIVS